MSSLPQWCRTPLLPAVLMLSTIGCALHGDLVALREELTSDLKATRAHVNERLDKALGELDARRTAIEKQQQQALAEIKNQMQAVSAIQAKLKDLQAYEDRQQKTLDDVKQQIVTLTALHGEMRDLRQQLEAVRQALGEVKTRYEALQREQTRLHAAIQTFEEAMITSLKAEQAELRDRLKALDKSVKDLEHLATPTVTHSKQ